MFDVSAHLGLQLSLGVIGTGLFLGTATALQNGGPVGLLLGYGVVGTICYSVMVGPILVVSMWIVAPYRRSIPSRCLLVKWWRISLSPVVTSNWRNVLLIPLSLSLWYVYYTGSLLVSGS